MQNSSIIWQTTYIENALKTIVCTEDFVIDQNLSTITCPLSDVTCTDELGFRQCRKYYGYFSIQARNPANPDYPDDFVIKVPPNQIPIVNTDINTYTIGYQKWNGVVSVLNDFWFI